MTASERRLSVDGLEMGISNTTRIIAASFLSVVLVLSAKAQDYEREPILYGKTEPHNRISQLIERLQAGQTQLQRDPQIGCLRLLLEELEVPMSSRMLIFSQTSL